MIGVVIQTIVSLGLSYVLYRIFLKRQKTFQFNRAYLILTLLLCLAAPTLEIEFFETVPNISEITSKIPNEISINERLMEEVSVQRVDQSGFNLCDGLRYLYEIITACFIVRFLMNFYAILKLTKQPRRRLGELVQINVGIDEPVSTFFNFLFINDDAVYTDKLSRSVISHEMVHYKQLHTLDIILVELLICIFWFNPFIWLYKRVIAQNHEFIADQEALTFGIDIEHYTKSILKATVKGFRVPLTSGFNFIQIKNRIMMLHQSKSSLLNRTVRITTALVLFAGVFMLSSFKDLKDPLVVVIDPGHGGHDPGNLNESDIVFKISKALANLSDDKISIILTKDTDKFLSLKERTEFVNNQNADLFVSLHCNTSDNTKVSGVEVFYANDNKNKMRSLGYGWLLLNQQLENKVVTEGKMKNANFYVLRESNCPSVVVELGFLSNKEDSARLNAPSGQKEIAKALYEGLLEIREKKELIELMGQE